MAQQAADSIIHLRRLSTDLAAVVQAIQRGRCLTVPCKPQVTQETSGIMQGASIVRQGASASESHPVGLQRMQLGSTLAGHMQATGSLQVMPGQTAMQDWPLCHAAYTGENRSCCKCCIAQACAAATAQPQLTPLSPNKLETNPDDAGCTAIVRAFQSLMQQDTRWHRHTLMSPRRPRDWTS